MKKAGGGQERAGISCHDLGFGGDTGSAARPLLSHPLSLAPSVLHGELPCAVLIYLSSNHGHFHLCARVSKLNRKSFSILPGFHSQSRWVCSKIGKFSLQIAHQLFLVRHWKDKINNIPFSPPKRSQHKNTEIWTSPHFSRVAIGYFKQEQTGSVNTVLQHGIQG